MMGTMTPFHEHRDSSSSEVFWYLIASEVRMKTTLHQDAFLSFSSLPIPRPFRDLQTTDATTISISSTTFCPLQLRILQATHRSTALYFPHPQAQHVAIERFLLLPYLLHHLPRCHPPLRTLCVLAQGYGAPGPPSHLPTCMIVVRTHLPVTATRDLSFCSSSPCFCFCFCFCFCHPARRQQRNIDTSP
jgi:hypothetical protein